MYSLKKSILLFIPLLTLTFTMSGCQNEIETSDQVALINKPVSQVLVLSSDQVFELSSCSFTTQAPKYLKDMLAFNNNQPENSYIKITSFTDNVASDADQLELTRSQSESLAAFLWSQGIQRDRLVVKGTRPSEVLGHRSLTPEQQALSRRIEINTYTS